MDEIKTEIKILESVDSPPKKSASTAGQPNTVPPLSANPPKPKVDSAPLAAQPPKQNVPSKKPVSAKPNTSAPTRQVAETPEPYAIDSGLDDMPPPPDNFPDDWDTQWQPSFEEASIAARPEPKVDRQPIAEPRLQMETPEAEIQPRAHEQAETKHETLVVRSIEPIPTQPVDFLPSLYVPLAQDEKDKDHPPQQITVILRSTGDKEHDRRRIKTIYGTLISFHGHDRFSFQIFEDGKGYLIDFPNDTTRVCPEVLERLKKLMGEESWRVEEITFQ